MICFHRGEITAARRHLSAARIDRRAVGAAGQGRHLAGREDGRLLAACVPELHRPVAAAPVRAFHDVVAAAEGDDAGGAHLIAVSPGGAAGQGADQGAGRPVEQVDRPRVAVQV